MAYPVDLSKFVDDSDQIFLSTEKVQRYQSEAVKKFDEELEGVGVSEEFKSTPEYR